MAQRKLIAREDTMPQSSIPWWKKDPLIAQTLLDSVESSLLVQPDPALAKCGR
jgi:hypothetical protein